MAARRNFYPSVLNSANVNQSLSGTEQVKGSLVFSVQLKFQMAFVEEYFVNLANSKKIYLWDSNILKIKKF